jgi:hypothetical protein
MATRRSRRTALLVALTHRRLSGCAECVPSHAEHDIDDVVRLLRLNRNEVYRLFRSLRWPSCESDIGPGNRVHTGAGRFHSPGQRALYVADDPVDATVELVRDDPTEEGTVWIKEFRFERPLRVIDLSVSILGTHNTLPLLLEGVRFTVRRPAGRGPASEEYHVTRYVADLVRKRDVDGLVHTISRAHPFP